MIDNLATGRTEHLAPHTNLKIIIDTISNQNLIYKLMQEFKPDVVVHAACSYKDPDDWYNDTLTNCVGGAILVDAAKKNNVKRFIYFQTALCYGLKPIEQPITLNHPRKPEGSSYAISKTANELYIEQSGIDFVTFRLANIVGPRNLSGALPIFYKRLSTGQRCMIADARRDFVDVRDLASVVLQAVDGRGNGAYHFSSGKDVSILEMFNAVADALQFEQKPDFDKAPSLGSNPATILLDPTKTYADFEMPKLTSFNETVKAAVDYYKEHGVDREITHLKAAKS